MKKRIFSLLVLILVAICGGVFAACAKEGGENVSIKTVAGLDSQLSSSQLDSISNEILLLEGEKDNLSKGFGYNNSVKDGNAVSLVVGSEENGSRELIFEIENFEGKMSDKIFVSSDSSCIQVSKPENAGFGKQKVVITAVGAGTAEVVVKTGQFLKSTKIVVKAIEKLSSFSIKTNATIYLERGKELTISPEAYLNFFPAETNLREVEFYDGETLLTKDGKTVLSTVPSETATGYISESKEITVKSLRLSGNGSIQTISVVVVDSLSDLSMRKLVYSNGEKTYPILEKGKTITVIRNVSLGEINYGVRELYVIANCKEESLEIVATAKGTNLLLTVSDQEHITPANFLTSKYGSLIDSSNPDFSAWVYKFELKYEGISSYEVEFGFKTGRYTYGEIISANVEFKSASNLVTFAKPGEDEDFSNTYTIYDYYTGTYGSRFAVTTNTSDEFSKAEISLVIPGESALAFKIFDVLGNEKLGVSELGATKIVLKSGENFFIKANEGVVGSFTLTARVAYTFEGVEFVTEKTITLNAVNSPTNFFFNKENGEEISSYVFDLNASGKIVSGIKETQSYAARNSLVLSINGYVGSGALTGAISDFVIVSSSPIIQITKNGSSISILATGTGTGSFKIVVGNGISRTFTFNVIQSVSDVNVFVPSAEQNSNIISVVSNYSYNEKIYDQYALVKKNSLIPLVVSASGEVLMASTEGENIDFSNGKLTCIKEFNKNELTVSITYQYVDNEVVSTKAVVVQQILISSIVEIENFSISTNFGSSTFSLYDYLTVGYYSRNLATATLQINILPNEIREEIYKTITFSTNANVISEVNTEESYTLLTDIFEFVFYRTGASAGTGTLVCKITNEDLFDSNGNLKLGKVTLLASIDRSTDSSEGGNFVRFIQFNVKRATKIEVINSQTSSVELDSFTTERKLDVSTYPLDATNSSLSYVFIPQTSGLKEGDVEIAVQGSSITLKLADKNVAGEGVLRIIALDSYTSASDYETYLDIPVIISNGSQQFPYYINFESDVQKMIATDFEKYYIVSGEIDLSEVQWEPSKFVLSGGITGRNNAKFKNIKVAGLNWNDNEKTYFGGLFTEIGSEAFIRDISFEFSNVLFQIESDEDLNRAPSYNGFLGALAGRNSGTIENVSVSISNANEMKVTIKGGYTLSIGGMFGENMRLISTSITSSSTNNTLFSGRINFIDSTLVAGPAHILYVGGVAGRNSGGRIERTIEEGLVEFNNSFASVNATIDIRYASKNIGLDEGSVEGVGSIAGLNRYQSSAIVEEMQGIFDVSSIGEINANKFQNIGGIVGQNDGQIIKARSQVYVRGGTQVGGAVGINSGTLESIIVENLFKSNRNGEENALIVGLGNVGGIIGKMTDGQLNNSSFISYIGQTIVDKPDLISSGEFGLIVGKQEGGIANYVVAIANVKSKSYEIKNLKFIIEEIIYTIDNLENPTQITYTIEEIEQSIAVADKKFSLNGITYVIGENSVITETVETEFTSGNYAIFARGDSSLRARLFNGAGGTQVGEENVGKTKAELKEIEGFKFIFIPTGEIGLTLTEDSKKFEMRTDVSGNVAFYLYYYQSANSNNADLMASKNLINLTSLLTSQIDGRYQISSSDSSIIEILSNGLLKIKKTGEVVLTASSEYVSNGTEQKLYIKVVNYTNNISVYLDSNKANEIKNNVGEIKYVVFDATESKLLYINFLDKFNVYDMIVPSNVKILLKVKAIGGENNEEIIVKEGEAKKEGIAFRLIKISSDSYQLAVVGEVGKYEIEIVPYIEFVAADGHTYTSTSLAIEKIKESDKIELQERVKTYFNFENTTKSINISKDTIVFEPYYEKALDVEIDSLNENETITISITHVGANGKEIEDQTRMLNVVATYNGVEYSNSGTINLIIFEMNGKTNNKFALSFKIDGYNQNFSEKQYFIIKISSSNEKQANINLEVNPQSLISISATLYPIVSLDEQKYGFKDFSYIPSGVLIPGQNSLIELALTPQFTYFNTIEIVNASSNEYNLVFDLYDRTTSSVVSGAKATEKGISISRNLIENGSFSLRTFADQRLSDNSSVTIYIILKDANGNQIGEIVEKTFYVEHLPGVIVTIDGVSSGNKLFLAQGVSYDMDIWVKGYLRGAFSNSGAMVTDGQVVLEIEGSDLVAITRDLGGNYKLTVASGQLGTNRTVKIKSYGINAKGERSKEVVLEIEIVEFVVKTENVGDIISGAANNIYSSATGNSYLLDISLNSDILIYDRTNERIKQDVLTFLKNLATQTTKIDENNTSDANIKSSVWQVKDFGEAAPNFTLIGGNDKFKDSNGNEKIYTSVNGAFKIYFNTLTKRSFVKFLKTESSAAPTLQIRFESKFHYSENGTPTVGEEGGLNSYTLVQVISFDVSERTSLTNPYPIYTYEQLLDMRENSHYVLMEDITLPEDFTPIKTKIAMLDGNGHKIIVPSISLSALNNGESMTFGLFETLQANALLKNITLYVNGTIEINLYNYSSVNYGLLVGENNGKITNCAIEGSNYAIVNLNLFGTNPSSSIDCEVGSLVAINNGDITNSRVEVGISINSVKSALVGFLPANLGGLVSINNGPGTISSSYVKARIENNTAGSVSAITGGLVTQNTVGGKIFACYTSGENTFPDITKLRASTEIVYSTASASGFVYFNSGEISNCYSNIPVRTNEGASGFVYQNQTSGKIINCYSTSGLESSARNGAFVGVLTGVVQDENPILNSGAIIGCFAWEEKSEVGETKVNSGLASNEGVVTKLEKDDFKNKTKFSKFAFSSTANKTDGVWFWANAGTEAEFLRNGIQMDFSNEAPQLVSPNLIASAVRTLVDVVYDNETETTLYNYEWANGEDEGTKYNPYIIASQADLEYLVSKQSGFTNGNIIKDIYCRLVGDIIYETSTASSGLFQYAFLGNLEGNSYTIGNYVLDSSVKMDNGGFFASIGTASNHGGSIKNLTFAPRYMSLTNCNSVGAVAGSLFGGTLVNINIDGTSYASEIGGLTIIGKNAVGGVVGTAEGSYNLNNIISYISVNSTYRAALNGHTIGEYQKVDISKVSYAGLIAGIAGGYGKIVYIEVGGNNVSVGENASLMFGYVGKDVNATTLTAKASINQTIKADIYGGVIAAHNYGSLEDIKIIGLDDPSYNGFFDSSNYVPTALGNIVGIMSNGLIKDAVVTTKIKAQAGVESLGGAVGLLSAGELNNIKILGDITGGNRIGGVIGQVRDAKIVKIHNCINSGTINSNSSSEVVTIGTLIGFVNNYKEGEITYQQGAEYPESGKIRIANTAEFVSEVKAKLESGEYTRKVNITCYATSFAEVWYGVIVTEDSNYKRGLFPAAPSETPSEAPSEELSEYEIANGDLTCYVPLIKSYQENGKDPTKAKK